MWSRYHYRHSHGVTTLQIFIPVITPLTLDLFSAIFSKFCNQMYLIKIWNRVQLTCLLAGSLDAHQWTSRFAVKNKNRYQAWAKHLFHLMRILEKWAISRFFVFAANWGKRDGYRRFLVITIIIYTPKKSNGPFRFFCLFLLFFFIIANSFLLSSVSVNYIANPSLLSATDIGTIMWLTTIER